MFSKIKFLRIILITAFCLGLGINTLQAAWWDTNAIPEPPDTQKVNEETRTMANTKIEVKYYSSDLGVDEIRDFYNKELPDKEWKESEAYQSLLNSPEVKKKPKTEQFLANNLVFEKGEQVAVINFLPQNVYGDQKTRFTVSRWKREMPELPQIEIPEIAQKPKKDVAPAYPGASLIGLEEDENSLVANYLVLGAGTSQIEAFYRENMIKYGWSLDSEEPAGKVGLKDMNKYYSPDKTECPECQASKLQLSAGAENIELLMGRQLYRNDKGDTCLVVLNQPIVAAAKVAGMKEMTTITVRYEKKKE